MANTNLNIWNLDLLIKKKIYHKNDIDDYNINNIIRAQ